MTLAEARRYGLGICVTAGIAATIVSAAIISAVVSRPEQVVTAMANQDAEAILRLITDGILAALRGVVRYL